MPPGQAFVAMSALQDQYVALRLVEKVDDEAASSDSATTRGALGITHLGQCSPEPRSTVYCCASKLQPHTTKVDSRILSSVDVRSIPMPTPSCESSKFCTALHVKSNFLLLTSFHAPKLPRPIALPCRHHRCK